MRNGCDFSTDPRRSAASTSPQAGPAILPQQAATLSLVLEMVQIHFGLWGLGSHHLANAMMVVPLFWLKWTQTNTEPDWRDGSCPARIQDLRDGALQLDAKLIQSCLLQQHVHLQKQLWYSKRLQTY